MGTGPITVTIAIITTTVSNWRHDADFDTINR
jgi:hypothetical protein